MKRILSVFLSVLFLLTALPLGAVSVSAATSGTTGDCTWTLDDNGHLTISGNGEMRDYWYSCGPWGQDITSVTIEDGVTTIGSWAFRYCDSLTSLTIPDSVTTIGKGAFDSCDSLLTVIIPDSVTTIGDYAFSDGYSLTAITVAEGNANYRDIDGVLFNKDTTTLMQYPAGKMDISYMIPDSVTTIGADAFRCCGSLTAVTIPDGVTTIGESAFNWCTSLTAVTIPNSVTTIGDYAFCSCYSLMSVTIPDGITTIGRDIFGSCVSLKSVIIPDSVTTIGNGAFSYCDSLESVTISNNVTTIDKFAFEHCVSLTSVTIPDSVNTIGHAAFLSCSSLTSVTIPDSVTTIEDWAFGHCDSLTAIQVLPDNSQYSSENGVLFNEDKTTLIQYPGGKSGEYTIPDSVTTIRDNAFNSCYALTSVVIPDSVTVIENSAFCECTSLTSVTIPDSVIIIEDDVFYGCTSLTTVDIPDSVTTIEDSAFYGCTSLTSVTIPNSVTTIMYYAFCDCTYLTAVAIPDSVTTIGEGSFYWCDSLTDVYYGGSEEDRAAISIGDSNSPFLNATWHYNYGSCVHEYAYPCDQYCSLCGELTNPDAAHTVEYVAEVPATCTENGNVEYWYCSDCGSVWLDAECTLHTNRMNVVIPATDHTYDSACDTTCNVCGTVRDGAVDLPTYDHITEPTILIPAVAGKPGETVSVQLYLKNNPGLVSAKVKVGYDADALELIAYEKGDLDSRGYSWGLITKNPFVCNFCYTLASEDCTEELLATLTFRIKEDAAAGVYPFTFEYNCDGDFFKLNWDTVNFTHAESVLYVGDVVEPHTYDNACDSDCNLCGEVREVSGHVYDNVCDTACNLCGGTRVVPHTYDNPCDPDCNTCGGTRVPPHEYDHPYDPDCNMCLITREVNELTPGDVTGDGKVNIRDLGLLQQYLNGWDIGVLDITCDVNADDKVNIRDLGLLQQYLNGWDVELKMQQDLSTPEKILEAALALKPGESLQEEVQLQGKVIDIETPYSAEYNNITVNIRVNDVDIKCYRMTGNYIAQIKPGDTITVMGRIKNYNGILEFDIGCELTKLIAGIDPNAPLSVVESPKAGVAYKFGMVQPNASKDAVYYLRGGMSGFYMATSSSSAAAVDVYLEETSGGYYLYAMVGGEKKYINMVVSGTHVNGAYESTASTVYTYDTTAKTLVAEVDGALYWFGTRNDKAYTTVGPCKTEFEGFYCQFYA